MRIRYCKVGVASFADLSASAADCWKRLYQGLDVRLHRYLKIEGSLTCLYELDFDQMESNTDSSEKPIVRHMRPLPSL